MIRLLTRPWAHNTASSLVVVAVSGAGMLAAAVVGGSGQHNPSRGPDQTHAGQSSPAETAPKTHLMPVRQIPSPSASPSAGQTPILVMHLADGEPGTEQATSAPARGYASRPASSPSASQKTAAPRPAATSRPHCTVKASALNIGVCATVRISG